MPSKVIILSSNASLSEDTHFTKMCHFLGIDYATIKVDVANEINWFEKDMDDPDPCLVLTGIALSTMLQKDSWCNKLKTLYTERKSSMLVYDLSPDESHIAALKELTGDRDLMLAPLASLNSKYHISDNVEAITKELSGIVFGPINSSDIIGKVFFTLYPFNRMGFIK